MVKFKTLKYKHLIAANRLLDQIAKGEITQHDADMFAFNLVASWDYTDIETGKLIPPGQPDELSIDQYNEAMLEFQAAMEGNTVKKTNEPISSSGSTGLNQGNKENLIPLNG